MKSRIRRMAAAAALSGTLLCTAAVPVFAEEEKAAEIQPDQEDQAAQDSAAEEQEPILVGCYDLEPDQYYYLKNKKSQFGSEYPGAYCKLLKVYEKRNGRWNFTTTRRADVYYVEHQIIRTINCDSYNFYTAPCPSVPSKQISCEHLPDVQ